MDKNNIDELIAKYLQHSISDAEQSELFEWVSASEKNEHLFEQLTSSKWLSEEIGKIYTIDENKGWERISAHRLQKNAEAFDNTKNPVHKLWPRLAIAICIMAAVLTTILLRQPRTKGNMPDVSPAVAHLKNDVKAPEKNRAMITLSNGKTIYLDSLSNGTQLTQNGVNLVKQTDGQLAYQTSSDTQTLEYNSLYNPRGSKVLHLTLSDGTKVWLNSETTLRYPINFIGNERRVEITGEAYFEVSKMPLKPFKVVSGKTEVEVLGTHFNVNAYPDEDMVETTLLEGKVKLQRDSYKAILLPGQQGRFSENTQNGFIVDPNADLDKVMAWKQDMFQFDATELPVIMRQISRWYNRDIVYEKKPGAEKFGGGIGRNVLLSDVLKMLEVNGIHFTVTEKAIIVKP